MNSKRKFFVSIGMLQVFFVVLVIVVVSSVVNSTYAQGETSTSDLLGGILGLSAAIAIFGSTLGAGIAIKTVGTAAISALTENERVFFKAFLVIALGEALAIYGLIVAILLWIKIPGA
ncbi:MAG: ATP synthase subunit C [Promethearchaeota archaeon]